MSLDTPNGSGLLPGVRLCAGPEGLAAIRESDSAAVLWQRRPLDAFQHWLDTLPEDALPRARTILRPGAVADTLEAYCDIANTPTGAHRSRLVEDAAALAEIFARDMGAPYLRLRLEVVTGDACRRFHIDRIHARLLCTYRGSGTQFGLAAPGETPDEIRTAATGSVLVLRGTLWPARHAPSLLHRSPPIADTGEARLVLVLDPVFDEEEIA